MKMKTVFIVALSAFLAASAAAQPVSVKELKPAEGNWKGTYSFEMEGGKKTVKPVSVRISSMGRNRILVSYLFSDPAQPAYTDTLLITHNGYVFAERTITQKSVTEDGALLLVTESQAHTGNQPLWVRHSYLFGKNRVQLARHTGDGNGAWHVVNEYLLSR
ncbi:hypothetical protein [Sediminibacterium soli]|uniref:hypothetical protein n=1 Tax=Sediminibacterium soli TaxID=2698829 RepID=UPI00137B143B|nr:hypothetical protein [Sediminibacterium soli]NCI45506.1 hypothetical protein [Sediminibacterium soli]